MFKTLYCRRRESVRIRSYSCPHFLAFELNTNQNNSNVCDGPEYNGVNNPAKFEMQLPDNDVLILNICSRGVMEEKSYQMKGKNVDFKLML